MDHWNVFDANCVVGRHLTLQAGGLHSAEHLLADMDHYGIAEALVLDPLSRENHPIEGNERVLRVTAGNPRLHPVWSALPTGAPDEQPSGAELLCQMRARGVAALTLFPRQYRFELSDWCIDDLLEPLAAARVPVFINYTEVGPGAGGEGRDDTDWNAVVALCRRFPSLPVVVSEYRIRRTQRLIYRALEACPNLHLELSAYWLHRGIEYISERWGAERLLFGSNWPASGPHMTLATLTTAEISDDAKRGIAGDTLRRLLRWRGASPPPAWQPPPPADEFVRFARSGIRPPQMTFLDCHGHRGSYACHYHLPACSLEGLVADMDRLGVRTTCIFSFMGVFSDEQPGNDLVADAVRRYPEHFVGFTLLNPHRGRDAMLAELERGARLGLRGIKLIPYYQGYPEEGPLIDVACQWAHDRRQIILNHGWGSATQMERLLSTYPNACFITGHATAAYADIMKTHANLFVCSCPLLGPRACEDLVQAIGADRLLFGSDLEDLPMAWGLGPILFARLSPQDKRHILGGNLQRILASYSLQP
jgi:predicted TIM-barrel fold metal-dependent hydrolase